MRLMDDHVLVNSASGQKRNNGLIPETVAYAQR